VKVGTRGQTWDSLPTPNFGKVAQGDSPVKGKFFLSKIRYFRDFELLKPTFVLKFG